MRSARPIIGYSASSTEPTTTGASWYAWWLINLSELPALLQTTPVRSELIYLLVDLDKLYTAGEPGEPWESYYARRIFDHFHPAHA